MWNNEWSESVKLSLILNFETHSPIFEISNMNVSTWTCKESFWGGIRSWNGNTSLEWFIVGLFWTILISFPKMRSLKVLTVPKSFLLYWKIPTHVLDLSWIMAQENLVNESRKFKTFREGLRKFWKDIMRISIKGAFNVTLTTKN